MAVNISKTFLHDAENVSFRLAGERFSLDLAVQRDFDPAPRAEFSQIPLQRHVQPGVIQKRRMEEVRNGANALKDLIDQGTVFGDGSRSPSAKLVGFGGDDGIV